MMKDIIRRMAAAASDITYACLSLHARQAHENMGAAVFEPAMQELHDCFAYMNAPKNREWQKRVLRISVPGPEHLDELLRRALVHKKPKTPSQLMELALTAARIQHVCAHIERTVLSEIEDAGRILQGE